MGGSSGSSSGSKHGVYWGVYRASDVWRALRCHGEWNAPNQRDKAKWKREGEHYTFRGIRKYCHRGGSRSQLHYYPLEALHGFLCVCVCVVSPVDFNSRLFDPKSTYSLTVSHANNNTLVYKCTLSSLPAAYDLLPSYFVEKFVCDGRKATSGNDVKE